MQRSHAIKGLLGAVALTLCVMALGAYFPPSAEADYACDEKIFDDGTISNVFYVNDSLAVMARKFEGSFSPVGMEWGEVNTISLGDPYYPWPDPIYDPIELTVWEGDTLTGLPVYPPIWTTVVTPSDSPAAVRVYPPDTILSGTWLIFLGMRNPELPDHAEGLAVDSLRDFMGTYRSMDGGQSWTAYSGYGDWHIRACLIYPEAVQESAESHSHQGILLRVIRNPFRGTAVVRYSLFSPGDVNMSVYDSRGALVAVLADGYQEAGVRETRWSAKDQPDGVYFCRMQVDDLVEVVKMIHLE